MDVAEFYQWVRDTLNRGNTLDDHIPKYIQSAVRHIERKRDFQQLEWWGEFTLTPNDDPIIDLPSNLKRVRFLRYNIADSAKRPEWVYLSSVSPQELISRVSDNPKHYWQKGDKQAILDAKLDSKNRTFELSVYRFTTFPTESNGSGVSHWLVDAIPDGLHALVMQMMSGFIREDDPNMIQNWRQIANQAIMDLEIDDEYNKEANGPGEMSYWPDHIPYDRAFEDSG